MAGTEHTERVELEAFSGSIIHFAVDKEDQVKEAKRHSDGSGELYL